MADEKKENKEVKTFQQIEQEAEEQLNTFVFIVFVPNPNTHGVRLWIDGGEHETYMNIDRFLDIIGNTCGIQEENKLAMACSEYGTPFIYDRQKSKLRQLHELPPARKVEFSADYHKQYVGQSNDPYSTDNYFNAAQKAAQGLNDFGLPDFDPANVRLTKT